MTQSSESGPPPSVRRRISEAAHHSNEKVTIQGAVIPYSVTAGTAELLSEEGEALAHVFHVAYVRSEIADYSQRPVIFAFNGGPGVPGAWLHLGALGPYRVAIDGGVRRNESFVLAANPHSLLDQADLVFIDPVSTGFSRAADGQDPHQFHGVVEDVESVASFIQTWTSRNGRWMSPKILVGESYGTTRAAALVQHLQDRHSMYFSGVVLMSAALMFQTILPSPGNDLPYVMLLPSYALAAAHHDLLHIRGRDVAGIAAEAEEFALGDFATHLLKGSRVSGAATLKIARRVARYSGLSLDYVQRESLRVPPIRFFNALLQEKGLRVGRLDSRITGTDVEDEVQGAPEHDPSYTSVLGAYGAAVNDYLRTRLGIDTDLTYEFYAGKQVKPWNYAPVATNRYLETATHLRQAMDRNISLQVLLMGGYYDLATPYLSGEWALDHMGLHSSLRANVVTRRYHAGHILYATNAAALEITQAIRTLVTGLESNSTSRPSSQSS